MSTISTRPKRGRPPQTLPTPRERLKAVKADLDKISEKLDGYYDHANADAVRPQLDEIRVKIAEIRVEVAELEVLFGVQS